MNHCQVLPPLCPFQVETAVVGSQHGPPCGSCGSISTVTMGKEPVIDGFPASPDSIQIPHPHLQVPSAYDNPQQITVLTRCGLPRNPRGLAWHQNSSAICLHRMRLMIEASTLAISNSTLPHALAGECKHIMPNTYRGWTGHYQITQWELRKYMQLLFELATVRRQIWGNDHLSCGFGLWRSHLASKWKSGQGKVGLVGCSHRFFHVNFGPPGAQKFDLYRIYCLKWGRNNLLVQECMRVCILVYSHVLTGSCSRTVYNEWPTCTNIFETITSCIIIGTMDLHDPSILEVC